MASLVRVFRHLDLGRDFADYYVFIAMCYRLRCDRWVTCMLRTSLEETGQRSAEDEETHYGPKLSEDLLDKLSPEQIVQLSELLKATKEIWINSEDKVHDQK
ncbi:hypothetical protein O181_023479 [Austropuccinia psidii MF-1]|uniref:Uncharacterized protein n=1 Tax=Austropuccinia psidii MF-1 TaxID=1389203 RepID=A0A9Q3CEG7_9BASI|nr:hypothetical protein [Austropuccinia psidii MF-1]